MKPETDALMLLFQLSDVGWVFEQATFDEDPDQVADRIRAHMDTVDSVLANKFPAQPHIPLEEAIRADSTRFKPLVQAFASPVTAPMCAMIYSILEGAEVTAIQFSYKIKKFVEITVSVEYETGEQATFSSNDAWDVEVLRHFGIMKLGDDPVIDGYYAFPRAAD